VVAFGPVAPRSFPKLFERLGFVRNQLLSGAVVVDGEPKDKWKMVLSRQALYDGEGLARQGFDQ
jgi:hypothetical protein